MRRFALALLLIPVLAVGQSWPLLYITVSQTGVSAAAISGGVTTSAIPMGSQTSSSVGQPTHALVGATVGSSTTMTVTCTGSVDGESNYRAIERCADGSTYIMHRRDVELRPDDADGGAHQHPVELLAHQVHVHGDRHGTVT